MGIENKHDVEAHGEECETGIHPVISNVVYGSRKKEGFIIKEKNRFQGGIMVDGFEKEDEGRMSFLHS